MAKKTIRARLTYQESVAGTVLFLLYLFAFPLLSERIFNAVEVLLDRSVSSSLRNVLYYYFLFAAVLLLFHRYLADAAKRFLNNIQRSLATLVLGLLLFYGANELIYRVGRVLLDSHTNLNDMTIAAQVHTAPRMTTLIIVLLAPFVEEVFFRGLVFDGLRDKSRLLAYLLSSALFAFLHVWTFALSAWDATYFVLMLQYLVPGFVFAWTCEHSGTIAVPMLLHAAVNALSLWTILR